MARANIARAILVLLLSAPDQRQARTKGVMNEAAPGSGLNSFARSKVTHSRAAPPPGRGARAEATELYGPKHVCCDKWETC